MRCKNKLGKAILAKPATRGTATPMRQSSALLWFVIFVALFLGWRQLHPAANPASAPAAHTAELPTTAASEAAPAEPTSVEPTSLEPEIAPEAAPAAGARQTALPAFLPPEAGVVIGRIQRGGPFPHPQDGSTFGNFEGHLPRQPRGWYREYTVPTPGLSHRGTRRIVTGGQPPRDWFYSADHYRSFRRFDVSGSTP